MEVKDLQYHVVEFQETKRRAANITADGVSINLQGKQDCNKNNENYYHQVTAYDESEANKSTEIKYNKKKMRENKSKTRAKKMKSVIPIQQARLTSKIYRYCPLCLGNIPLSNW